MQRAPLCIIAVSVLAASTAAPGQQALERFERQLEQIQRETLLRIDTAIPTEQRLLIDYGALASFNFFAIDDPGQNTHILRRTEVNPYFRMNLDNVHEVFVRASLRYDDFNTHDDFDGHGDEYNDTKLERAYYRFDYQRSVSAYSGERTDLNLTIQGGRQLVHWANGLVLSQEIDGVLVRVGSDTVYLDILAGRTNNGTVDIDSSRPAFTHDTTRDFYGGMLTWEATPRHRLFAYGLVQQDHNDQDFNLDPLSRERAVGLIVPLLPTAFEYNSYYVGIGASGNIIDQLLYSVEAVYEGGEGLSNSFQSTGGGVVSIPQTKEDIDAWAFDVRLDYLLHDPNHTRAGAEVVVASGDDDRLHTTNTFGGNASGTKDHAFNAFGLVYTGLAYAPNISNLAMLRLGLSTFPAPDHALLHRLQLGANVFVYGKTDHDAAIDEPSRHSSFTGSAVDLFANWQVTDDVSVGLRYGIFFPGAAIATDHDPRHFVFLGINYAF